MSDKLYIEQLDSTNNRLKEMAATTRLPDGFTLYTFYQTAGRGQQGNTWDSEPGKNLLFSTLFIPNGLLVSQQFRLSMAVSVSIVETLRKYITKVCIKWPNDIYYGDRKLGGILIENLLAGNQIGRSVVGIGINVNQTEFREDIPNPISLKRIAGEDFDKEILLDEILQTWENLPKLLSEPLLLKEQYMSFLYRGQGLHLYRELKPSINPVSIGRKEESDSFRAAIRDVLDDGRILLEKENGERQYYHFKQIQYIITP